MAKKVEKTPFDLEYEEAKRRYVYPFRKAEAEGVPREEILEEVKANRPEKWSYRIKRGVKTRVGEGIDYVGEGMRGIGKADIGEVIQQAPRKVWERTVPGHAIKGIGEVVDKVAPWASEPLVPTGKTVKRAVTPPKTAGGVRKFASGAVESALDLPGSLTTPKDIGMLAGIAAFPPAAMALVPEMALGAWEGGVGAVRNIAKGDYAEAGRSAGGGAISGAMAKGIMGHAKARVERVKVKREVEAAKQAEAEFNAEWDAAKRLREVEVPGTPGIAATMDMPVDRAPVRKVIRPQQPKPSDVIRLNAEASGEPIPLGPRAPRRVIIRKPGEVEVVPTKVDVSDAIFPRPRDIEVPGTRGIAETMDMPIDRAPRRTRLDIDAEGKPGRGASELEPRDVADLVKAGALPEFATVTKPFTLWDAIQDTIKKVELSETLDRGYTGEIRDLRQSGVKGVYKGAHEKVVNAPGGKIVNRAGTMDKLREALVEEGIIPPEFTLAEAAEFIKNEQFRHSQGKSAPYTEAKNFNKMMDAEHFELGERAAEAAREAQREAKNKPLDPERQAIQAEQGDLTFDVADTMKATFTKEAATDAMKPKRRSKAAQAAEKRALLEDIARQRGIAEKEIAAMTNKELAKAAVKEIVPTVGGQIETRSVYEQARQRAIQREIAKRAGKAVGERAPMAAGATAAGATKIAPSPQPTTAPSPLASTTDVAQKVLSKKELAEQKDLAGKFGTSKIDRTRGLEELVRNQKGDLQKIHKETQDKLYAAQKGFAHTQAVERKAMMANLKKIGIKVNTANMKRVQEYGEKVKTLEQVTKEVGPKKAQQIVEADKMFRATYNRFINEINRVRKENGEAPIEPRADYYRHVVEMGGDSIGGIADAMALDPTLTYGHGGKSSILKKRTANMKHEVNALNGFLDYLPQYALETNLKPFSHYAKGALNDITNMVGGEGGGNLKNTRALYKGMVRDAARDKSKLDTSLEDFISSHSGEGGLKAYIGMKKVGAEVIRNTVAKFSPIVTNFAAYANAAGEIGVLDAARGFARTMKEMVKKTKTSDQGYFVPERFESRASRKANTKFWKRNSPLSGAFEIADQSFITRPIWNAMYEKGLRLKEADPVRFADAETGKIVGARSIMDRPEYYNSSIGRQLTPFTLEVNNFYRQVKGYLKGKKGGQKSTMSAAWKLTKMMAASHLINLMLEEITGNPVLFDPYQAVIEAAEKDDPVEAFGRIASEALSIFPSASLGMQFVRPEHRKALFGRSDPGRYGVVQTKPFRSAGKLIKGAYRAATGGEPVEGKMNAAIDLAGSLVGSFGTPKLPGGQIKATGQGFNVLANDGEFMWGAVPVKIDTSDPAELLRLLVLGPYATNAFKEVSNEKD